MPGHSPDPPVLQAALAARARAMVSPEPPDAAREVLVLFDQFHRPLLRYGLSLGLRVPEAEDVVQEVFLSLFRHLHLGRSRRNLRGWIFRVAHNLGLKQRESDRREERNGAGYADRAAEPTDECPGPKEQVAHRERERCLRSILRALPEQDRSCLSLRAEGLRYREIAEVLDMSLGAVSISLTRSLARLRRADRG
jgi:RNA polymerase sigma-70 factor (ECF subfamily)